VRELHRKLGTSPNEEYERLERISNEARVKSEQARLSLEQHLCQWLPNHCYRAHSESNLQKEPWMTVGELRKKLERIDRQIKVVVQWEIDSESTYFDVSDVSLRKGTPSRVEGIAGFTFGGDRSPAWLFLDLEEA
jgi:hypothetical protein